eukprot:COSAG06_NODE_6772_length_2788_cov_1.781703_2_plen_68_part_00
MTFDEQQPHQLMLLLNEVLGEIDASQKVRRALGHPHTRTVFAAAGCDWRTIAAIEPLCARTRPRRWT